MGTFENLTLLKSIFQYSSMVKTFTEFLVKCLEGYPSCLVSMFLHLSFSCTHQSFLFS
uniref:Uncharacterized protein n=1 Tax=Anguilla anguilla TaxID=7936 RepID=A0A0E9P9N2_ANGAN